MSNIFLTAAREAERAGEWERAIASYESAFSLATKGSDARLVAELLRRIGVVRQMCGQLEPATETFEASLAVAEAIADPQHAASALICLANLDLMEGRLESAERLYLQAGSAAGDVPDDRLSAMVEQNLGTIANIRGEVVDALDHYRTVLDRYRRLNDEHACAGILINMGMAHVDLAQWDAADGAFAEAFVLTERLQDAALMGDVQINRAELYFRQRRYDDARSCADRALEIFGRMGSAIGRAEVFKLFGMVCRETGRPQQADVHLDTAVRFARESGNRLLEAEALAEWALVHLTEERNAEALDCLNRAHHGFAELSARRELLDLDRRLDGLEGTYLRVVAAWGESIEGKDRYTAGHCERVANYACMLAEAVGFSGRDLTWMRMGGYLHDVGKIAVPAEILNKAGKLTDEEFRQIQRHTVEGDAIVSGLNFPWDIRPMVRWHHERWDGSGYPDGLKGEQIPLTARILCVADVYDALTTTRSYRAALSSDEALAIMERDVGRFFDPALFDAFRSRITRATPLRDQRFPEFGSLSASAA